MAFEPMVDPPINPRLSILLSTKDQATTLERCLRGIHEQTFRDYELLILDDGSTDDTSDILRRWASLDPRIRLFRNPAAQGVIPAYQFLQGRARGEFIWHAASDDFCVDPNFLQEGFRLHAMSRHAAGFFCNTLRIMMPGDKPHGVWGTTGKARFIHPETFLIKFLKGNIVLPGCAAVIRRDYFQAKGGFDIHAGPLCDLLINAKLGSCFGFFFTGTTSMHSTVYAKKFNFGSSFSSWEHLKYLAYLEAKLRDILPIKRRVEESLWHSFRYLYLGKYFDLEHLFRQARKSFSQTKKLRDQSSIILTEYASSLRKHGFDTENNMSVSGLLSFSFRNPFGRLLIRILNSFSRKPRISP